MKYCINCGNELKENEDICSKCGSKTGLINKEKILMKKKNNKKLITVLMIILMIALITGSLLSYFVIKNNYHKDVEKNENSYHNEEINENSGNKVIVYKYLYNDKECFTTNSVSNYIKKYEIKCENNLCKAPNFIGNMTFFYGSLIPINDGDKFFIYDLDNGKKIYEGKGNYDLFVSDASSEGTAKNNNLILTNNESDGDVYYYANKNKIINLDGKVISLVNIITADNVNYDPEDNIIIVKNKNNKASAINIDTEEKIIENVDSIYCYSHTYCYVLNDGVTTAYNFKENKTIKLDNDNILIMANGYIIMKDNKTYRVIDMNNNVIENIPEATGMSTYEEGSYSNGIISIIFQSEEKFFIYKFDTNTKTSKIEYN